jgi:hypothetical protein
MKQPLAGASWFFVDESGDPIRQTRVAHAPGAAGQRHSQRHADFEEKWHTHVNTAFAVQAQTPQGEPCLSIVDYMNWAIYRAFTRGEMRYFRVVGEKVTLLVDLYDTVAYPQNWYSRRNPFDTTKITPL